MMKKKINYFSLSLSLFHSIFIEKNCFFFFWSSITPSEGIQSNNPLKIRHYLKVLSIFDKFTHRLYSLLSSNFVIILHSSIINTWFCLVVVGSKCSNRYLLRPVRTNKGLKNWFKLAVRFHWNTYTAACSQNSRLCMYTYVPWYLLLKGTGDCNYTDFVRDDIKLYNFISQSFSQLIQI